MGQRLRRRLERSLRLFKCRPAGVAQESKEYQEQTVMKQQASSQCAPTSPSADEIDAVHEKMTNVQNGKHSKSPPRRPRELNAINSLCAIRLKMILFTVTLAVSMFGEQLVHAGFFTFYFPNIFKLKGFGEITDMIESLDNLVNETRDTFADAQYFWGQLQQLDPVQSDYPEESACTEVFPQFRELAIAYVHADFEHYIKPFELYREHLVERRAKWYPAGLESKAALPREWEQNLYEKELDLKIEWMEKLVHSTNFKGQRERLREIWRSVRRGLDTSVACIYLRYAYREISEDINETALEANLESMKEAMKVLEKAYERIEHFKQSDKKIIQDIEEELKKVQRFTIR